MPKELLDILVIDDDDAVLDLLRHVFDEREKKIETANSIENAMQKLKAKEYRVLLCDHNLSDGEGIDFLASLPEQHCNSVPILMTGVTDATVAIEAINRGQVYKFIQKPLDLNQLLDTIKKGIERHRNQTDQLQITSEISKQNLWLQQEATLHQLILNEANSKIETHRSTVKQQQLQIESLYNELQKAYFQTVTSLTAAIEAKDTYTKGHSERVAFYCKITANELGVSKASLRDLMFASSLHDLGKIGIPDSILHKKEKLTDEEYELITRHPELSESILEPLPFMENVRKIIRQHHERYDGNGYPDGLKREQISLEARILAVSDAYDAMRSDRSYRKALGKQNAFKCLRDQASIQFCPLCVGVFIYAVEKQGEYPEQLSPSRSAEITHWSRTNLQKKISQHL